MVSSRGLSVNREVTSYETTISSSLIVRSFNFLAKSSVGFQPTVLCIWKGLWLFQKISATGADRSELKVVSCNLIMVLRLVDFCCSTESGWLIVDRADVGVVQG